MRPPFPRKVRRQRLWLVVLAVLFACFGLAFGGLAVAVWFFFGP